MDLWICAGLLARISGRSSYLTRVSIFVRRGLSDVLQPGFWVSVVDVHRFIGTYGARAILRRLLR